MKHCLKIILNHIQKFIEYFIFVLLSIMIINLTLNVLTRYIFKLPIIWCEEFGRYVMVWFAFLGMSLAIRNNEHVGVTAIFKIMPYPLQKVVKYVKNSIILFFLIMVLIKSLQYMSTLSGQISAAMEIPMSIPYFSVTIGTFLMIIMLIYNTIDSRYLNGSKR